MHSEGVRMEKAVRGKCTVLVGALQCLGASALALLPGQCGESGQLAIYTVKPPCYHTATSFHNGFVL